jgi:opacity protein-like surface antigen
VGYGWFDAHHSFDASLGHPGGVWFGGGVEYRMSNGLFVQGSIARFRRTGERVFAFGGQVFRLGVPDTFTITPVALTAGFRFRPRGTVPYAGGGIGRYFYGEEFKFADPSENIHRQFTSYHALAGIEWRASSRVGTAVEVQYTHVPNDLTNGLGDLFNEHDLGGVQARVKFLFGK